MPVFSRSSFLSYTMNVVHHAFKSLRVGIIITALSCSPQELTKRRKYRVKFLSWTLLEIESESKIGGQSRNKINFAGKMAVQLTGSIFDREQYQQLQ